MRLIWVQSYAKHVMNETPTGKGFAKLREKDRKSLEVKFNAAYYLAKKERPFSDYPELLDLQERNGVNNIGKSYRTDRSAAVFTDYISEVTKYFKRSLL